MNPLGIDVYDDAVGVRLSEMYQYQLTCNIRNSVHPLVLMKNREPECGSRYLTTASIFYVP